MKKLILPFVFVFSLSFASATTLDFKKNCHAEACEFVGFMEEFLGDNASEEALEDSYNLAFNACQNN